MSRASVRNAAPEATRPGEPLVLRPVPEKPRGRGRWLAGALALGTVAGLAWFAKSRASDEAAKAENSSLRTAAIRTGDLDRTIRVSGIVSAERFAALMAPQLRGSRGASGTYGAGKSLVSSSSSTSSTAGSSTASSTSSTSPASSANPPASATSTNTALSSQPAAGGTSSLGAIRGTQNRFGDRQAGQTSSSTTAAASTSTSSALGSSGLGSTAANLLGSTGGGGSGGGGAGGGDSDFALVLVSLAKPGSRVKKGEIVAEFDKQYQLNRLDDYRATVAQLNADATHLKADLAVAREAHAQLVESAKADWDKALLDLKTAEVRSAIEAEDLKLAVRENEARYRQLAEEAKLLEASQRAQILAAEIERDQAKLELDRATMNVNRMVVVAPMDGIAVMQSIWRSGDFGQVQQGDQVWPGQTFMQVVDPSSMVVVANLNQVDAESVRLGVKAAVQLDAYPGVRFPARVIGIGAMTKPGVWRPNYMREIPIRLKLGEIDERVIPDLSASADLLLGTEKSATLAPLSAVWQEHGQPFVFLETSAGWQRHDIELGPRNRVAAVVRSGLSPGDVVAVERPAGREAR